MQASPIGWIGGKKRLRKAIIERIPAHSIYAEVFSGAAWVLFGKDRNTSTVEIINDLNGELTNFFRCVRDKPLELVERLQFRLINSEEFHAYRANRACDRSETERAACFFWALRLAYASRATARASFGYRLSEGRQRFRADLVEQTIRAAHERLQDVLVFSEDFEALIKRVDRDDTFFYCDPPYYGIKGCYTHELDDDGHKRLVNALRAIKGKFLLSYNDCAEIRKLYGWAEIEPITTRYSIMRKVEARDKQHGELLIRNYDV